MVWKTKYGTYLNLEITISESIYQGIEKISKNPTFTPDFLEDIWEELGPLPGYYDDPMKYATKKIDEMASKLPSQQNTTCDKSIESILVELAVMKHAYIGGKEAGMGTLMAYFRKHLGPYFSIKPDLIWPDYPLGSAYPTNMEENIAMQMIKLTSLLSNGMIKNVTILDLPCFGAIGEFKSLIVPCKYCNLLFKEKRFTLAAFIQANFAAKMESKGALTKCWIRTSESKSLFEMGTLEWMKYIKDTSDKFPLDVLNHTCFNFTQHIVDDFSTFLMVLKESYLDGGGSSLFPISDIAKQVLEPVYSNEEYEAHMRPYDKLFLKCSHGKMYEHTENDGNVPSCDLFSPSLTSQGLCYSFNSARKSSDHINIAPVLESFENTFEEQPVLDNLKDRFKGVGPTQGNLNFFHLSQICTIM